MTRPTTRHFQAYLRLRHAPVMSGITVNDAYNVPTFGIDKATYDRIHAAVSDKFGLMASGEPLTVTDLRKLITR